MYSSLEESFMVKNVPFFKNAKWNFSGSVDTIVENVSEIITAVIDKFVPSCTPSIQRPTPWWDRHFKRI